MKQALYLPARSRALLTAWRSAVGWRFIVALLLLLGSLRGQAQTRLFWVQSSGTAADDRLSTANLDGSNRTDLASGNSASTFYNPNSLAIDVANNIAYVGDAAITGSTGISRFNATTGAFLGTIVAGSATVGFNGIQVVGSRIYWVQSSGTASSDQLCSANLDGSGLTVLASGNSASTFYNPNSLAIDVANNIAYVGDAAIAGSTGISRFNATTGTFLGTIVAGSATVSFNGIQVVGSRIYWVQSSGTASSDQLCSANLDGSGLTVLASGNSASTFYNPNSLAIDVANNIAYVGDAAIAGSTGISRFNATTGTFLGTIVAGSATVGFNALATNAQAVVAPTVTTGAVSNLTTNSATVSGTLTSGGNANTTYGIVYVPGTGTPTTSNSVATVSTTSPGTFPASFAANLTGLAANTTYTAAAYATNSAGTDYGSNVTFKTAAPTIALSPTTLTAGTVGTAYSQTLTAAGGTAPYTFAITAGALPAGLTLASTGTLAGTPTAGGSFTFSVRATDASASPGPYNGTQTYTLTIGAPTITVAPATLPNGATGTAYSQTIMASGGTSPYSLAITAGALPAGLTLASNGTLSGTPTVAGSFTFTVTATDASTGSGPYSGARSYTVTTVNTTTTVSSVTRLNPSPTATTQVSYRVTFAASVSGISTANFSVTFSGSVSGASVSSVSGSGTTYTVVVNTGTGTGNGTLRLDVANTTNISPTLSNVPYTLGETYTITRSFAAAPTLRIQAAGSASNNGDVTAFVDVVQVLQSATSTAVANGLQNGSFETNNVPASDFKKTADGVVSPPWSFTGTAGVARTGSGFAPPTPPSGDAVALIQSAGDNNASISQNLAVPTGSYQINFQTAQRNYTARDQRLNVFVNDVFVGDIQPIVYTTYEPFTSATFTVTAPALTATVSTTSGSPTSTSPIPFSVSFSQSVGTTFVASDVTVSGGTLNTASFSGSGSGPYTFTVTPNGAGTVSVSLVGGVAFDANNTQNTASNSVSVQYQTPTLTVNPATLPGGTVATAYSQTVTAAGGTAPYTFAITAGALPAGLTLTAGGVLAGTPTVSGSFTFTITSTDASAAPGPFSGSRSYTVVIGAPTIMLTPATLPTGTVAAAYSQMVSAASGTAPYSFAITAGALPAGLTLSSGGTLSGTPTAGGSFSFTITATDASTGSGAPYSGARAYTLSIGAPTITVDPATLPSGTAAAAYSTTITASGGTAPYSFAVTAGALPAGLNMASNGILSGTPTTSGTFNFTITATDASTGSGPYSGSRAYSLTIAPPAALAITPVTLPNGTVAVAYSQAITASGGTAPYTYALTAGALPAGLSLTAGGVLTGTPTAGGSFTFTVTATDAATGTASTGARSYTLTIAVPTIAVAPTTLPNGAVGAAYSQTITASGGTAPYTYSITAGALPAGVSLTSGGVLSGTPTASGTFTFTVRATDASTGSGPYTGSRAYSLTIAAPTITVTPTTLAGGTVGTAYSQPLTASGGLAPYTYTVAAGALPSGLTLSAGGVLSGTPTAGGSFSFTITATDAAATPGPYSGAQAYTLAIAAPTVAVSPTTLPAGTIASAYSQPVTASGGTAPYTFTITAGALPTGLTLAANGTLSGTPTASGSFTFTITATDASTGTGPYTGARSYTVSIATPASVTWTGTISPDWFTAGNWSPNVVPSASISATIPASAVFQPAISAGTATTLNLTLNSGATLTMNGGTLDVRGNLTSNGSFLPTGGTVVLGTTFQSNGPNIFGSSRVRFWNLTVNSNGILLSTSAGASVRRLLTLNGAFVTQGNEFVLESDATGTAMVVNSSSAGFVFGSATVQRYIDASGNTGTSGYRHYSSPVGSATVSSLSTSAYGGSFTAQVNTAYNTADPNLLTLATYPNVFSYDESKIATSPAVSFSDFDKGYQSSASLGSPLTVGRGYAVQIGNNEKVQFTGPLNNNTQTISGLTYAATGTNGAASAGWALVGNPYPAPLDWRTVGNAAGSSLNGVDGAAYVFQSTSAYSGRYTSFTNNVGAGTGLIASGQGFFVRTSTPGTTGSITLSNSNRVTSYASPAFQRTTAETRPLLRLSLGLGSQPATVATAQDETFVYFETGATDGFDGHYDAYKLTNPSGYYLGSVTPGTAPLGLSIDGRSPLAAATTTEIPLWVSLPAGTYSLTATELLNFANLAGGTTVQLRDALLGTLTDLATVPSYSFSVAANAAYAGRFSLVFRTSGILATLPGTELAQAKASLYPNPAASATALSVTGLPTGVAGVQVDVLDVLGRAVGHYTLPVHSGSAHQGLSIDQLAGTLYLLRLTALNAQGQVQGTLPTQRLTLAR